MRDTLPFFDIIVLPTDAGPNDPRIEIDGTTDQIRIYDNTGALVGIASPETGWQWQAPDDNQTYVSISTVGGIPVLALVVPNMFDAVSLNVGEIYIIENSSGGNRSKMVINPGNLGSEIDLFSSIIAGDGSFTAGTNLYSIHADDYRYIDGLASVSAPRGLLAQFIDTTDDGPHTVSGDSDMLIDTSAFDFNIEANFTYWLHLHTQVEFASVVAGARWNFVLEVNGVATDRFGTIAPGVTGTTVWIMDSWLPYTPSASGTPTFGLNLTEIVNGADITLQGAATAKRYLQLYHAGSSTLHSVLNPPYT